ncbi:hypothetical protein [Winogradskya humida]|uniref:Uncharacterized protein n=1 Tax=Winogradskya humida TaxID=113566 RepID=A0ABQ3ZUI2_9ACTN|nr:hypothetical protein [Actinoplanes humidus]GIE22266.1 hypothetical protein Ahu01nite_053680 [Actinoplanes humidus]
MKRTAAAVLLTLLAGCDAATPPATVESPPVVTTPALDRAGLKRSVKDALIPAGGLASLGIKKPDGEDDDAQYVVSDVCRSEIMNPEDFRSVHYDDSRTWKGNGWWVNEVVHVWNGSAPTPVEAVRKAYETCKSWTDDLDTKSTVKGTVALAGGAFGYCREIDKRDADPFINCHSFVTHGAMMMVVSTAHGTTLKSNQAALVTVTAIAVASLGG